MKNLPVISGWEPEQYRAEAEALRERADRVMAGKWCQGAAARDANGFKVDLGCAASTDELRPEIVIEGVCFCMGTHLDYFTPHPHLGAELVEQIALPEPVKRKGLWNISKWNDAKHRKAYQVARAFRAAAARAERYATILERVPA